MIRHPTIFVVGAGASRLYGLPTGAELKDRASQLKPSSDIYQLIARALATRGGGLYVNELNGFLDNLRGSQVQSIDQFLEDRQLEKQTVEVGKAVIAALIGQALTKLKQPPENEDWLLHIIRRMRTGVSDPNDFVKRNPVQFITFNFDTRIEERIPELIWGFFGRSCPQTFPVIHIHGKVGSIPDSQMKFDSYSERGKLWLDWINRSAAEINVTSDSVPTATLERAQSVLGVPSLLCFLGFSYDEINLNQRLSIPAVLTSAHDIFGSAWNVSVADQRRISLQFHPVTITLGDFPCRQFLDKFYVVRET